MNKLLDFDTVAYTKSLYVLDKNGKLEQCYNPLDWLEWMKTTPRVVKHTLLASGRDLITLFVGYSSEHKDDEPLVYCTLLKPEQAKPEFAVVLECHYSLADAEAAHKRLVKQFSRNKS
jgi:hypothetical protein